MKTDAERDADEREMREAIKKTEYACYLATDTPWIVDPAINPWSLGAKARADRIAKQSSEEKP